MLGVTTDQAQQAYASFVCEDFLRLFPAWFSMSKNAREFLERHAAIHNSFATSAHDRGARRAIRDKFRLEKQDKELVVHYRSPNRLCGLYKAAARWLINHCGDTATVEKVHCARDGGDGCEIHIRWS